MNNTTKITQLWIYPVKSLAGIPLSSVNVRPKGFQFDRRYMLVDESGTAITQRTHPHMALFRLTMDGEQLTVRINDEVVQIPMAPTTGAELKANVWNDTITAIEPDVQLSAWFTKHMRTNCKLLFFPENNPRPVDGTYDDKGNHVSLADAFPFLIIGQSSLDELNRRLAEPVSMRRFRPNIVFGGGAPFDEDTWSEFRIGPGKFKAVKACARCILTTVDPDTGIKGPEPLKTLATFRKQNNNILFGQNVLAVKASEINVGDEIFIESYR